MRYQRPTSADEVMYITQKSLGWRLMVLTLLDSLRETLFAQRDEVVSVSEALAPNFSQLLPILKSSWGSLVGSLALSRLPMHLYHQAIPL